MNPDADKSLNVRLREALARGETEIHLRPEDVEKMRNYKEFAIALNSDLVSRSILEPPTKPTGMTTQPHVFGLHWTPEGVPVATLKWAPEPVIAYTIGNEANYDKMLAESKATGRPMRKAGKGDHGRDADYLGGWVFQAIDRAAEAAGDAPSVLRNPHAIFAVYEVELPGTWDECTYMHAGIYRLLVDAVVRSKVER
jgi:hypothetical protein